jgi:mannonate dehydratase
MKHHVSRRAFLGGACALGSAVFSGPAHAENTSTQTLIDRAMKGIKPGGYVDVHNHIVGMGHGGSGARVHPDMTGGLSQPLNWIRFRAYAKASGIKDLGRVDQEYMSVFRARTKAMPTKGRFFLLAFDQVYSEAGVAQPEKTVFYIPNSHLFDVVKTSAQFVPVASVHPYRKDAVAALHAAADKGAIAIKWLPNAMHIDPAHDLCAPAYKAMAERGLTLLSHGGEESAVPSPHTQEFGNPLRLRAALDAGVKVIVAHCASHGQSLDLDHPDHPKTRAFGLFMRMMDTPAYEGQLFGEISAILLINRVGGVANTLLGRTDLHHRLVNGSDHPIPGIDPLINLTQLWAMGLLQWKDKAGIAKLFRQNPLLGDFVLKRSLCLDGGAPNGFPAEVFCPDSKVFPLLDA